MEPHPMDYGEVFTHVCADQAQNIYKAVWKRGVVAPTPQAGHTMIRVAACFSEWLGTDSRTSNRFPPEYRNLANVLQPGMIWMIWKFMGSGRVQAATYDGLVWLGKHWAWFPSPCVHLADFIKGE
jgi:hypothetical protein